MATDTTASWTLFALFASLVACFLASWFIHRFRLTFVPESIAFVGIGAAIGGIATAASLSLAPFNADLFLNVLLPVIVFDAGFSTNRRYFFRNIGTISLLAIVGTVVSGLVIGYGLYGLQQAGAFYIGSGPLDALLFGALLSATDPVATLAIFGDLHVDRTLYALVFGESILNDAVAITLYQIFSSFSGGAFGATELFKALGLFVANIVGSLAIGAGIAALASLLLKHVRSPTRTWTILLFLCVGYLTYALASAAGLSGIFAIFFGAFVLKHYAFYNIDDDARVSLVDLLKTAAFLSETVIYVLLGLAFFEPDAEWNFALIGLTLLMCLIGRAVSVFGLTALANLGRRRKVPLNFQVMVWHAGLRGAMAFALSELLDPVTVERRSLLVTTTLGVVLITTSVIGSSTPLALRLLRIKTGDVDTDADAVEAERRASAAPQKSVLGRWTRVDRQYLMPFLSNRYRRAAAAPDRAPNPGELVRRGSTGAALTVIALDDNMDDDYLNDYDDAGNPMDAGALAMDDIEGRPAGASGLVEKPDNYDDDAGAGPDASAPLIRPAAAPQSTTGARAPLAQPLLGAAADSGSAFAET